jgi:hypothetical protein
MIKKCPLLQTFRAIGIGCLLSGTLSGPVLADSADDPGPQSRQPLLRPLKVVSTSGNVTNAEALVADHDGYATLSLGITLRSPPAKRGSPHETEILAR